MEPQITSNVKELRIVPPREIVVAVAMVFVLLGLFLAAQTYNTIIETRFVGAGVSASNTIVVSGEADVNAKPDISIFTVRVQNEQKDAKVAQTNMTKTANAVIAYLKYSDIDDKDIQTSDVSVSPHYEWSKSVCSSDKPCIPNKQIMTGYIASETITVKVRDLERAGEIASGVVSKGATQLSGPNFSIENEEGLKSEARDNAIANAREKAETLAKSLGVSLVRVVGFSEGGNERYPVMYATKAMDSSMAESVPAMELAVGENKISSRVSITYEIR